jgi:hypothetical protein
MKKISVFLALLALFFADAALARAVVTTLTGTAQAQRGTAAARVLRMGDEVVQGDTVSTGPNSSLVLRFDDGQVSALTSNSRMTVTQYQYNPQSGSGNVLLSLITGGMRAVTGLIGRNTPDRVSYRAATATIGIRGTDVTIVTDGGNVVVTVTEGEIVFAWKDQRIPLKAGEGINARVDGTFQQGAINNILQNVPSEVLNAIGGLEGLTTAINQAASSTVNSTINRSTGTLQGGVTGGGSGGGGGCSNPSCS